MPVAVVRTRRRASWVAALTAVLTAGLFSFAAGRATAPAVTGGDLVPAGVNNCVTAITGRLALLDTESIGDFDAATIAELRTLPERCDDPEVRDVLEADYPALLDALQTTGT